MLKKLNAFELLAYRRMLRISWKDKISNEIVLRRIQSQRILTKTIKEQKLRYFCHLVRRRDLQRVLMEAKVAGKRGAFEVDTKHLGQATSGAELV